jgi:translocation and assembly module TamB
MRRLLIIAGLFVFVALAVPTAGLYFLLFTDEGFKFIIRQVPRKIGNTELVFKDPGGSVAQGIRIGQLDIDHPLVHLTFKNIKGRVELLPLVLQTVRTDGGSIGSAYILTRRRAKPPPPSTPIFLPRWLIINAQHLHMGTATLVLLSGSKLEWTNLYASTVVRHQTIRFFEVGMQMGNARLDGSGELRAHDPLAVDVAARIGWVPGDQPAWSLSGTAKGDLNLLDVTAHTVTPFRSDITGQALDLVSQAHWRANAIVHDLDVAAWGGGNNVLGILSGQLALKGNLDGFAAHGPLDSSGLKVGVFDTSFEGSYSNHTLWMKHVEITHRKSGAHAAGAGTLKPVKGGPDMDLRGTWRDFQWPLLGKNIPFHSASGDFTFTGVWPYTIHAAGIARVRDLPAMPTTIDASLARDGVSFGQADVDLYDGHATLNGQVTWSPKQTWTVSGHATDLNPGLVRSDLPGKLSFTIATAGSGFNGNGDFSVDVRDLGGRLRGVAASGGGRVDRTNRGWQFDKVRVGLGGTNLSLDGHINDSIDLQFAVTSRDLSLLAAESRGQIEGSGTIHGTLAEPTIVATARGSGIQHEGIAAEEFNADINLAPGSPQYDSKVEARIHNLVYQNRRLDDLNFRLNGRTSAYTIRMDAKALGVAVSATAAGPYSNGVWQGQLHALDLTGTESVHLKLEHPASVLLSRESVRAEWLCLAGQPGSMCAGGEWNPTQWNAAFTAKDMPLGTFTSGLTPGVEYGGRINFSASLSGHNNDPVEGTLRAELADAELSHKLSSGRIDHTKIGSGLVTLNASHTNFNGEVGLESGDVGTIKGRWTAQRNSPTWQAMPVQGELHAHTDQLGLITLYIPDIDRASGHLDVDMKFAGTLGTPLMDGDLKISDGEIDYYQVNLGLRQLDFGAKLTDNGLDFNGSTRIGSGLANAKGRIEWRNSLPYGKVQVEGTNLRVVDVPEAQIDASPTLEFNINGRRIEATGAVKVPFAKIVPTDLTGAVRSSSDEVIVGQEQTDPAKRFEVVSTITLSLLDKVSVETSGLAGRLTGNVTVRSGYDEITRATGELLIEQGRYVAYARHLDIQRGRLIFTGGPIDNPGIDIRAIKEFPDVTAGINVRGTLLQPRLSFFSEPSLTQSQIVSLILSGGSLESTQGKQANNEALAQGGAILASQIGSRVGIEDVSLETDLTNETSLVLGRYLSPRLYVSYGVALTEQLNVLKLRYSLGDRWTIKTEVGQARGADLVYTIQH